MIYIIVSTLLGGLVGYLYWRYVGCASGTCGITSVWWRSTLYGMLMGGLLSDIVEKYMDKLIG
jgi:hypothetical protein